MACPTSAAAPAERGVDDSWLAHLTPCDDRALAQLIAEFETRRPAAIVVGPGRLRTRKVIDRFLASRSDRTCRIRIDDSCRDVESSLRAIVEAIGFGTRDLDQRDLDSVLRMFLSFQRTHRRRTVICLENAEECAAIVLGKLFELVDIEAQQGFGLFVVIAGHEDLGRRVQRGALRAIADRAGTPIAVSPLGGTETRTFVLDRIEAQDFEDATLVIEPDAILRMHDLSGGICDTVNELCAKSLELAAGASRYPITSVLIDEAAVELGLVHAEIAAVPRLHVAERPRRVDAGKLKLSCRGRPLSEHSLDREIVRIGRHGRNDLRLPSLLVSRYHALLTTGEGRVTIIDLGSSNGTIVNGNPIKSRVLVNGDSILIGDYRAEYVVGDDAANALLAAEIMAPDWPAETISVTMKKAAR